MDNATVLEAASNYIVQLQNWVKELKQRSIKGENVICLKTNYLFMRVGAALPFHQGRKYC